MSDTEIAKMLKELKIMHNALKEDQESKNHLFHNNINNIYFRK